MNPSDPAERMRRALLSLDGLSVGDAVGQSCFSILPEQAAKRQLPPSRLYWTDDTAMALGIVEVLSRLQRIDPDELASVFARNFLEQPDRGYGGGAMRLLQAVAGGTPWADGASELFRGEGSKGNGGAMRVAPLGAYFADDIPALIENACLSAKVTHAHVEGQDGAIAVALAAAFAWNHRGKNGAEIEQDFFNFVLQHTPAGEVHRVIELAARRPRTSSLRDAVILLGNGSKVCALDTVPLTLWLVARHFDNYEDAIWSTIRCGGDIDTTCAIVGGIVALSAEAHGIPEVWLKNREALRLRL